MITCTGIIYQYKVSPRIGYPAVCTFIYIAPRVKMNTVCWYRKSFACRVTSNLSLLTHRIQAGKCILLTRTNYILKVMYW